MSPQHRAERASEIFQERTALSRSRVVERERKKAFQWRALVEVWVQAYTGPAAQFQALACI